jgi:hypothetical protein
VRALDPRRLVFVDECSNNIALTRLYARAPKGERAYGKAPRNWGKNVTLICSLGAEGIGAAMNVEGATDGAAFEAYVEHFLAPRLKRGQIVVMDNLQVHKMKRVSELVEGAGAEVLFLPPYSPDMNPIEEAFSKVKGIPAQDTLQDRSPHPRGLDGGHLRIARRGKPPRCTGLVRALRLPRSPSLAMKSALALLPMVVWLFLGSSHLAIHVMPASSARGELLRTPSTRSSKNAPYTHLGE